MASEIVGGLEGGASNSTAILLNPQGQVIATAKGTGTNHHLIGKQECFKKIENLFNQAKKQAGILLDTPIAAIGLSLSGCEEEESNQEFMRELAKAYPNLAQQYAIGSDTNGSIATISNNGGIVCIAGTGSNTLLINPNGERAQCGGWGSVLGDEGSAWDIARKAIKYCFDDLDNFEPAPYSIDNLWNLVQKFFNIKQQTGILDYIYKDFDKSRIALMCKSVADLAREGDALSSHIFQQAGRDLAKSIAAVAGKASKELTNRDGGLHVICVGSVWLSWDLLQCGFTSFLQKNTSMKKLTLLRLKTEMGVGAAYMAADRLNLKLERDYSKNYQVFSVYNRAKMCNGVGL
ncbi:unnamed protein product [Ceutorhynchus assimilis]|uniref:N-acetyl-D-glucosamine kinase n=1 Tax=Ceutorhynchus assimilis TaxID=467358 RepID=A0A9N9QQX7_9CUCU|nr:unnamed protein product [Ceutorhynchus assimilis]